MVLIPHRVCTLEAKLTDFLTRSSYESGGFSSGLTARLTTTGTYLVSTSSVVGILPVPKYNI